MSMPPRATAGSARVLAVLACLVVGCLALSGWRAPAAVAALSCTGSSGHTDDFTGSTLGGAWSEVNVSPATPATIAVGTNPDCARITVPSSQFFDSWTTGDGAPAMQRTDMGANSWTIETRLQVDNPTSASDPTYLAGLMVRFGATDILWWGLTENPDLDEPGLRADRSGAAPLLGVVQRGWVDGRTVSLQIQKVGQVYSLLHRVSDAGPWIYDGAYTTASTVQSVGVTVKTWGASPTSLTADVDYFHRFTSPAGATDCVDRAPDDDGDDGDLEDFDADVDVATSKAWTWGTPWDVERPVAGPRLWINAPAPNPLPSWPTVPFQFDDMTFSCQRLYVPADETYDYWSAVDRAPKRVRSDLAEGDWQAETELNLGLAASTGTAASHVGMIVRFSQYDSLVWGVRNGLSSGGTLSLDRTTTGTDVIPAITSWTGSRVFLRIEYDRESGEYRFRYKAAKADPWLLQGTYTVAAAPQDVGIIAKTWGGSTTAVIADFNYFHLTRESKVAGGTAPGASCASTGNTTDFKTSLGTGWSTEIPSAGPQISATLSAGCALFVVPDNGLVYDDWGGGGPPGAPVIDDAPKLVRSDVGSSDWTFETKVLLIAPSTSGFHAGIVVRFGANDQILWGLRNGTGLARDRTTSAPTADAVSTTSPVAYLRVRKSGTFYGFAYRLPGGVWTPLGSTLSEASAPTGLGVFVKTFGTPSPRLVDFDYLRLTRADDVTTGSIAGEWAPDTPFGTASWAATGGNLRLTVPADVAYPHDATLDRAPKLRRTAPTGDFELETKVAIVGTNPATAFHTGLLVQLGANDAVTWGFYGPLAGGPGTNLVFRRTGSTTFREVPFAGSTVYLRVKRIGAYLLFSHRATLADPWTFDGTLRVTATPTHVGYIAITTQVRALTADFDEFQLTPVTGA